MALFSMAALIVLVFVIIYQFWKIIITIIIALVVSIILISIANFANIHTKFAPPTLTYFLQYSDIFNYRSCEITPVEDLFTSQYKSRTNVTHIIVHHSAELNTTHTTILEISEYHKSKGWGSISYHYFVNKDGKIYQNHNDSLITFHAENYNEIAVGVCLQGNFDLEYPTNAQLESLSSLLSKLKKRYNIPISNILRHSDTKKTSCPGAHVNLESIKEQIQTEHYLNFLIDLKQWYSKR